MWSEKLGHNDSDCDREFGGLAAQRWLFESQSTSTLTKDLYGFTMILNLF